MKKDKKRKFHEKIPTEKEFEPLEQYARPVLELTRIRKDNYSKSIGSFFISFSKLETALDYMIITSISDRSDERGYRIIKYLEFNEKIKLAKDEYQRISSFLAHKKIIEFNQKILWAIIKKLEEISEFRNKIAHANWESLDAKGFVRTKIKEDKLGLGVHFEKIKITPEVIYKFTRQIQTLSKGIDEYVENIFERINT